MNAAETLVRKLADVYTVDTDQASLIALVREAKQIVASNGLTDFQLTTSGVVNYLRKHHGIVRSNDTVRLWARTGQLPVRELQNGPGGGGAIRLFRERDVDEFVKRMAERNG